MSAARTRNRVVVFRLSEEEYALLQNACKVAGGRNLSDFTRAGLLTHLGSAHHQDRFSLIEDRLANLQQDIQAIRDSLVRPS